MITSITIGFVLCVSSLVTSLAVGIPLFDFFEMSVKKVLFYIACVFLITTVFAAIYTLIATLNKKRAIVAVACILTAFILLLVGSYIDQKLSEPETYPVHSMDENGELIVVDEMLNPNAVTGTVRDVYELVYDFLPSGQAMQCYGLKVERPVLLLLYSALIIVGTTSCGVFFFRRKDLK